MKYRFLKESQKLVSNDETIIVRDELAVTLSDMKEYIIGEDFETYRELNPPWPLHSGVLVAIPKSCNI